MKIHTLGPSGTNCERAALEYLKKRGQSGEVVLHDTLEAAADVCKQSGRNSVLLGCIVYPRLHEIVFQNLGVLRLVDCFVMDTYDMVFASNDKAIGDIRTVGSHPAPRHLVELVEGIGDVDVETCDSNSNAAILCADGRLDACITTLDAVHRYGLKLLRNFGAVSMGFSIHGKEVAQ